MRNILPSGQNDFASWPWKHEQAFLFWLTKSESKMDIRTQTRRPCHGLRTRLMPNVKLWSEYWWNNPKRNPRWITYSSYEILIPIGSSPRSGSSLNRFWSSIFSFVNFYQFSIFSSLAPHETAISSALGGRLQTYLGVFDGQLAIENMLNYFTHISQFIRFEFWQRRHHQWM